MSKPGYVYILTNHYNTTLYVGVTSKLGRRIEEHKIGKYPKAFSKKYNLTKLVYYCRFDTISEAISHEKRLKKWRSEWKEKLIAEFNSDWRDLYPELQQAFFI